VRQDDQPPLQQVQTSPLVRSQAQAAGPVTEAFVTDSGAMVPDGYLELIGRLRVLLDQVRAAVPPPAVVSEVSRLTQELSGHLLPYLAAESDWLSGQVARFPGRGQLLVPVYRVDDLDDQAMTGSVRFGQHYLGSNGAAHGGAVTLLFDDALGRLALTGGRSRSRTAYLHVDYRAVTPVEEDLRLECWFDREEGRKRFLRGVIRNGDQVCAEAEGLFVAVRPGQP
jgi:acyl-coenzyme A thioesterase PaaI-like protein